MSILDGKKNIVTFINLIKEKGEFNQIYLGWNKPIFVRINDSLKKFKIDKDKAQILFRSFVNLLSQNEKNELNENGSVIHIEYFPQLKNAMKIYFYKDKTGYLASVSLLAQELNFSEEIGKKIIQNEQKNGIGLLFGDKELLLGLADFINQNCKKYISIIEETIGTSLNDKKSFVVQKQTKDKYKTILETLNESPDYLFTEIKNKKDLEAVINVYETNPNIKIIILIPNQGYSFKGLNKLKLMLKGNDFLLEELKNGLIFILSRIKIRNHQIYELIDDKGVLKSVNDYFLQDNEEITEEEFYDILEKEEVNTIQKQLKNLLKEGELSKENIKYLL